MRVVPSAGTEIAIQTLLGDHDFNLHVELCAGSAGLNRLVTHIRAQKPGLALAGFTEAVRPQCIQVIGRTEAAYLKSLEPAQQEIAFDHLLGTALSGIIITSGLDPLPYLVAQAEALSVPLFTTPLLTEAFMTRLHNFLEDHLGAEVTMHGVILDVFGVGVLLQGKSGIGKSECALDLVLRGHRLVADDAVVVKQHGGQLLGRASPITLHHMEVRGLGIINVQHLFGAAAVRDQKRLELVVELQQWTDTKETFDRTGLDVAQEQILDSWIPKVILPLRPGRNVASIVEVAARNHLLRIQGYDQAELFQERLQQHLAPEGSE